MVSRLDSKLRDPAGRWCPGGLAGHGSRSGFHGGHQCDQWPDCGSPPVRGASTPTSPHFSRALSIQTCLLWLAGLQNCSFSPAINAFSTTNRSTPGPCPTGIQPVAHPTPVAPPLKATAGVRARGCVPPQSEAPRSRRSHCSALTSHATASGAGSAWWHRGVGCNWKRYMVYLETRARAGEYPSVAFCFQGTGAQPTAWREWERRAVLATGSAAPSVCVALSHAEGVM